MKIESPVRRAMPALCLLLLCALAGRPAPASAASGGGASAARAAEYGFRFGRTVSPADRRFVLQTIARTPPLLRSILRRIHPVVEFSTYPGGEWGAGGEVNGTRMVLRAFTPERLAANADTNAFMLLTVIGSVVNSTGLAVSVFSGAPVPMPDALSNRQAKAWGEAFASSPRWKRCWLDKSEPIPAGQTATCYGFGTIWAVNFAAWALGRVPNGLARWWPFPLDLVARARFASLLSTYWRCRGTACGNPSAPTATTPTGTTSSG